MSCRCKKPCIDSMYTLYQARGTMRKKETSKVLTHHLYLCMRDYMGQHVGEDIEIYFSLYDSLKNKYIRYYTDRISFESSEKGR